MGIQSSKVVAGGRRAAVMLMVVVWVAAGVTKLVGIDAFKQVLANHGVLSDRVIDWAWVVPGIELAVGVCLLASGWGDRRGLRVIGVAGSVVLLTVFIAYIAAVPPDIFRLVGCGCEGLISFVDYFGTPSKGVAIGIDCALIVASAACLPKKKPRE